MYALGCQQDGALTGQEAPWCHLRALTASPPLAPGNPLPAALRNVLVKGIKSSCYNATVRPGKMISSELVIT